MSFINIDDDQRWVPTHVQVTVLRGRGLRAKGKHGTSDVYTVIQVGKEKFTTAVVEKTTAPEWTEECAFELLPGVLEVGGQSAYPPGSSNLVLTVMHRALIGPDVFLGQAVIPLDKVFQDKICLRNEWYKLRSKSGRKEKERGEVQVTVQFTRNNLTASMFDLSFKDKPRSAFGKLKDRVTGRKRGNVESASAIVPGGYAALSAGGRRLSGDDNDDAEDDESRRSKVKSFFRKGKLRRSSDARSSTSLASECSLTSSPGGSLSPTAAVSMLVSDLSNSPSEKSNPPVDSSPVHPVQPPPKIMTHKRAFSDEASRVTVALPRPRAVETLRAQSGALSRSTLCINGSHIYGGEPLSPASTFPASLGLLQKCAPLSRSLQNLARRVDDPRRSPGAIRRWSFDRSGKEEKPAPPGPVPSGQPEQPAAPTPSVSAVTAGAELAGEGKKQKRNLFSHGRSDSAGREAARPDQGPAPPSADERYKGWFSVKDAHSKPSQEVSPMVETSTDALGHPSPRSTDHLHPYSPPASASPGCLHHANPFTPSPATPPMSPSNPFFNRLQCNPFYEELLADQVLKSAPPTPPRLSNSPLWPSAASPSWPGAPGVSPNAVHQGSVISRRERPGAVARQRSLPAILPGTSGSSPNPFTTRSASESGCEWDDSFEAFATSRLKSPRGPAPCPSHRRNAAPQEWPVGGIAEEAVANEEQAALAGKPPPLPPRRPMRTPVKEGRRDSWLDRVQEMAVKKEACLLSQTDAASLLHRREGDRKRNLPSSPQELFSDREAERMPKTHTRPSDLVPSPKLLPECPVKRFSEETANMQSQGSLETTAGGPEKFQWSPLSEHHPIFQAPDPNKEFNMDSAFNFAVLADHKELGCENSANNIPSVFGEQVEDKVPPLPPERHPIKAPISLSESCGTELCTLATVPPDQLCMTNQEKLDVTVTNSPEPVSHISTLHLSTDSSKGVDSLQVSTQASNKNLADLLLANIDSHGFPSAKTATAFEINNNTGKVLSTSQPTPGVLPTDSVHPNKCQGSIADIFSNYSSLLSGDCPGENGCKPVALEGPAVGSTSRSTAEILALKPDFSISTESTKDTAVSLQSEVGHCPGPSVPLLARNGAHIENAHTESTQVEHSPTMAPGEHMTNLNEPSKALATETGTDDSLHLPPVTSSAPSGDFHFRASVSPLPHLDDGLQKDLKEKGDDLSEKVLNRALANNLESISTLVPSRSEAKDHGPPKSHHTEALNHRDPAKDRITGSMKEAEFASHSQKSNCSDIVELPKAMGQDSSVMDPSHSLTGPSLIDLGQSKALPQEGGYCKQEMSDPPPKPPRIFNESAPAELLIQSVNERPEGGPEDEFQWKDGCGEPGVMGCPLSDGMQEISFKDLHAKVAPGSRSRSSVNPAAPAPLLHGSDPWASSSPSPAAETNAPSTLFPSPTPTPPTTRPPAGTTWAAAPSSTAPSVIGSTCRVLPQETCPADSYLPRHVSSPHPVKPLTATPSQGEKKPEGRSVLASGLEKLKSTIHPGRAAQPSEPEAERNKAEGAARYDHLTNNEIIALLLQREAELERQGAESEKQEALLQKREAELKKMKLQVRDLEDYIDRLLVRIMEQKPTLLQVRSRYK